MMNALLRISFAGFLVILSACTSEPVQPARLVSTFYPTVGHLPAVAAEFKTTQIRESDEDEDHDPNAPVIWRFWRKEREITIERPQLAVGEVWQRDGHTLIHRKLYHNDRRAIEFQDDDLRMLETTPSWQKLALLIDAQILAQLHAGKPERMDGFTIRDYQGTLNQTDWHIVMREDIGLPLLIERKQPGFSERTELLDAYPLASAPWQPTPAAAYDVIDFADLGDKEYDPFVIKVQHQMSHQHSH